MTARDEILGRLRARSAPRPHPEPWRSSRQFEDLARQFDEAMTAARGEVQRVDNLEAGLALVEELLVEIGARKVVVNTEPPLDGVAFSARWPEITWRQVGAAGTEGVAGLRAFCKEADAGLSGVDAALAETGSLVVTSGAGKSRMATLLPPVHIALVPEHSLQVDLFTWTAARSGALPANLTLISGPSKTADIEQTMAVGVHGPRRLIAILYR